MFIHDQCVSCDQPARVSDDTGVCTECVSRAVYGAVAAAGGVGAMWDSVEDTARALERAGVL